jgi:hypothetical protein
VRAILNRSVMFWTRSTGWTLSMRNRRVSHIWRQGLCTSSMQPGHPASLEEEMA